MCKAAIIVIVLPLVMVCATRAGAQQAANTEAQSAASKAQPGEKFAGGNSNTTATTDWAPGDVDEEIPSVRSGVPCSLPDVLAPARRHVQELVANLPQFTATERLEHQEFSKHGSWNSQQVRVFKYVVEMHEVIPGFLAAEETRDGSPSLEKFPASLADMGLPVLALVFHPYFVGDYNMACEGLGAWRGQAAWQVRFEQRADRAARLRGFVVAGRSFPLRLKGRAWISAESGQVLHLDTDLLQPVPQIRLAREHVSVEYRPVRFEKAQIDLWLPETAEVFMDFQGHRYRRRHLFSEFFLFMVDVNQRVKEPKEQ